MIRGMSRAMVGWKVPVKRFGVCKDSHILVIETLAAAWTVNVIPCLGGDL